MPKARGRKGWRNSTDCNTSTKHMTTYVHSEIKLNYIYINMGLEFEFELENAG